MAVIVEKTMRMSEVDIIKYQLLTYCFTKSIKLSDFEIECLSLLAQNGPCGLSDFARAASLPKDDKSQKLEYLNPVFKTPQTVRNFLTRAEKDNLIIKSNRTQKKIELNPAMEIQTGGTVLLNFKMVYLATKKD